MTLYRVEVATTGVLRIQADSGKEAEKKAMKMMVSYNDKKIFGKHTKARCVGVVEDSRIKPDHMEMGQSFFIKKAL